MTLSRYLFAGDIADRSGRATVGKFRFDFGTAYGSG
jgi:hypothetical protein